MLKPIKWSSKADDDFVKILDYLLSKWNKKVCLNFIEKVDSCIIIIGKNPKLFSLINEELQVRKCVITKHNSIYYRETLNRIEILRIYDNRQNPENLNFTKPNI